MKVAPQSNAAFPKRDTLSAEMFGDADRVVLTIGEVEEAATVPPKVVVRFSEYPNHTYWTNNTIVNVLVAIFGSESDEWIGKRVALEKVQVKNPSEPGAYVTKLYPMAASQQADAIAEYDHALGKSAAAAPAAKRARASRK